MRANGESAAEGAWIRALDGEDSTEATEKRAR